MAEKEWCKDGKLNGILTELNASNLGIILQNYGKQLQLYHTSMLISHIRIRDYTFPTWGHELYRQEETAKTTFLFILLVFKIELKWLMKELLHESSDLGGGHHGEGWGDGRHLYASPSRTFRPRTTAGSLQFTPTSTEFPSERENMIILLFFDMIFDHIYLKLQK